LIDGRRDVVDDLTPMSTTDRRTPDVAAIIMPPWFVVSVSVCRQTINDLKSFSVLSVEAYRVRVMPSYGEKQHID